MINDLALIKKQLRVDHNDEDDLIGEYMDAAEAGIRNYLDREELALPGEEEDPVEIPAPIRQAHRLLVVDMYENRSSQGEKEFFTNPAVVSLLFPYRSNLGV